MIVIMVSVVYCHFSIWGPKSFPQAACGQLRAVRALSGLALTDGLTGRISPDRIRAPGHGCVLTHAVFRRAKFEQDLSRPWHLQRPPWFTLTPIDTLSAPLPPPPPSPSPRRPPRPTHSHLSSRPGEEPRLRVQQAAGSR